MGKEGRVREIGSRSNGAFRPVKGTGPTGEGRTDGASGGSKGGRREGEREREKKILMVGPVLVLSFFMGRVQVDGWKWVQ